MNENSVPTNGANVYLGINYMFETMYGRPTGKIEDFPKRLEYGESYTIYYKLTVGALGIMKSLMKKDAQMNIMAIVTTSLGEYFESNKHPVSELTERI